jgi:N-acyl-D-aspartate/D-glutamate deacylase
MEAIEDIPGTSLAEGLKWDWESFPEYLDVLDRTLRTIDIAAQIPHHPLRVFVMGERGINREAATVRDIAEMRRLTEESLRAGAFGFTTSRTYSHKTNDGQLVPGHFAEEQELSGIGQAMAAAGGGAFGMNSDFVDEAAEFAWMTRLSKETGRPVWFLLTDRVKDPTRWRRLMQGVRKARAEGASITAQLGADQPTRFVQAESERAWQLQVPRCRWNGLPSDRPPRTRWPAALGMVQDGAGSSRSADGSRRTPRSTAWCATPRLGGCCSRSTESHCARALETGT